MMACESSRPAYVLSSGDMEDVLYDIHKAHFVGMESGMADDNPGARQYALFLSVLKKHDVTQAEWDSSLVYYSRNADELEEIYDDLKERMEYEASSMGAAVGESADTTDIWKAERHMLLMSAPPYTTQTWSMDTDSLLQKGERVTLRFTALFLNEDANRRVSAVVAIRLKNDSIITRNQMVMQTGVYSIQIADDNMTGIKSISGLFMVHHPPMQSANDTGQQKSQICSITNIAMLHELTQKAKDANAIKDGDEKQDNGTQKADTATNIETVKLKPQEDGEPGPDQKMPLPPPPHGKRP